MSEESLAPSSPSDSPSEVVASAEIGADPVTSMPLDLSAFHQYHRTEYVQYAERQLGCRSDAEEAVDQLFEQLARTWAEVLRKENVAAYVWQALKHRVIDLARARNRRPRLCEAQVFDTVGVVAAEDPIAAVENALAVRQALRALSERQRDVAHLRYFEGYSTAETASLLGISPAGVRSIERYALRHLRRLLDPEHEGETP